jgi:MFS family permease
MGFLGILEDNKLPHVPATVTLDQPTEHGDIPVTALKHGTGRFHHIVLVPQPSDDPNDPLNWPQFKKVSAIMIIALGSCLYASVVSGLLNAGLFVIAAELNRPIGKIALIGGYQLLVAASTGAFTSAFSRKYGKRPVYLVSSLFGLLGSIIGSATDSYSGLLAARIIQGGSTAAYEGIIFSTIGDLFFVHERGLYMAILQFALGAISMFANVITGPITTNLGWKWLFHLCIVFTGLQTLLVFFFYPETQFKREQILNIDETVEGELVVKGQAVHDHVRHAEESKAEATTAQVYLSTPAKKSYLQSLAVYTGIYTPENLLQLIIAPFASCANLAALWVIVISGTVTATYVAQAITLAQIFSPPPYLLSPTGVGNLFLGPFIGCVICTALVGPLNDVFIRWCAHRNNGVYEPEYRLPLTALGLFSGVGMMVFGHLCQVQANMYAAAAAYGINMFGITALNITVCSYGLDAFRDMSSDIFVMAIIYKNFLFYGFANFVNNWLASAGPAHVFYVFGGLNFALVASAVVFFFFGKRYRSFWARHNVLEMLHIKPHPE